MKGKSWLTVKEKILLHLAYFSEHHNDHRVPREVSQKGIAEAVGISQKHLSQYIRPMIKADLVLERSSYILEGRQRQKSLLPNGARTQGGRMDARWRFTKAVTFRVETCWLQVASTNDRSSCRFQ